jgi:hypothetical protein
VVRGRVFQSFGRFLYRKMSLEEILEYIMPKIVFKAEIFADILVQRQQKETAKRMTKE